MRKNKFGNELPLLKKLVADLDAGVREIVVRHDDWCATFDDGPCDCRPSGILVREDGSSRVVSHPWGTGKRGPQFH